MSSFFFIGWPAQSLPGLFRIQIQPARLFSGLVLTIGSG